MYGDVSGCQQSAATTRKSQDLVVTRSPGTSVFEKPTSVGAPLMPAHPDRWAQYPLSMSDLTSLNVPSEVRDRFATAARVRGLTVRALLDQLSREVADTAMMELAARQMSQLEEADPDAWNDYLAEGRHWEERTVEPLGA